MPRNLQDRLVEFAVSIATATRSAPNSLLGRRIADQLIRAGTAPAANYAEARESVSNKEYAFKLQLCLKELRETTTWLQIAQRSGLKNADYTALMRECNELTAICVTCAKKAKAKMERKE